MDLERSSLGSSWDQFVRVQIENGAYANADEVLRAGLRALEREQQLRERLRRHIAEGIEQADAGVFCDNFDLDAAIEAATNRSNAAR